MTDFVRIPGKVFAENASGIGNNPEIGQFGSAKAGTFVGTDDVRTIQDLEAWSQGWTSAVVSSNNYPPLPEMNGVLKVLSYQMCYLLQHGIPEWDSETTYYTNDYVNYNGALYFSTIDNNTTEPTTAQGGNNWKSGTVDLPIATTTRIGAVQPDGTTIGVNESGVISAIFPSIPIATNTILGICRPDNSTITVANGILTAPRTPQMTAPYVTEVGTNYILFSNKLIFQWGINTNDHTHNLTKAMANTDYCIVLGQNVGGLSGNQSGGWIEKQLTYFTCNWGAAGGFNWLVIGTAK